MNEDRRSTVIKIITGYAVSLCMGIGLLLIILRNYGYANAETEAEKYRILCDAFTIPGFTLMLCAGLVAVYNRGAFTGVTYGLRRTRDILLPFLHTEYMKYGEYKQRKEKKKIKHYSFLFFSGLLLALPAVYFMIRFYLLRG